MSYLTTNGRAGYRQAFESPQPQRASRTSILPMLTRRDHVQDEASHVVILCCARPVGSDLLPPAELSCTTRKSSQVRRPTARSGAELAPARNARAALPGTQIGSINRCLRRACGYPPSSAH